MKKKIKKNHIKIGILGGTFDPPHKGHLHICKVTIKKLKLSKLFWVVTKKNPLKNKPALEIKKRISLSKKISENEKKVCVRYFDKRINSTKTFNLLNYIKKKNLKAKLFFLIGEDNLAHFHKWSNWKKIPTLAKIVVFPRGDHLSNRTKVKAFKILDKNDFIFINAKKINISSSLIRKFW